MAYILGSLFRLYMKTNDERRIKKQAVPQGVSTISDLRYAEGAGDYHLFDIHVPDGSNEELRPVIIDFHGGAYYYGTKNINNLYCKYIAKESGFYVANVNYRVIDKGVTYVEQVQDILSAINYIYENADTYHFDRNNIFVTGDSAGAHLVAIAVNTLHSEKLQKEFSVTINKSIVIRAMGLTCGVYSFDKYRDDKKLYIFLSDIIAKRFKKETAIYDATNVTKNMSKSNCPVFLSSAFGDFLREGTLSSYKFMKENNIECELNYWEKPEIEGRKLEHVFNIIFPHLEESIKTNKAFCDFLKRHVKVDK